MTKNTTKTSNKPTNRKVLKIDPKLEADFQNAQTNWIPALVLLSTPILAIILVPWYAITHGFSMATYVVFVLFAMWSGLGITAGYHRLWSHKAYDANVFVRFILLVGATLAVQNSAFEWCAGHRIHHSKVDDVYKDPYSAKRGFWFSHIGWMLKNFPSGQYDYRKIKDLTADPMLRIQHDYYNLWVIVTNVLLPMAIGYAIGDMWGTLILAGLARLVLSHHSTFFINSLAHMWGSQPYTDQNSAKDNAVLAVFTWGEGYHNYHHHFQNDYRNGIAWWHYDPTKWLIFTLSKLRLTSNLKTIPNIRIQQARLDMQFKRAQKQIDNSVMDSSFNHTFNHTYEQFKERINTEYELFASTLDEWRTVKQQAMQEKIAQKKAYAVQEKAQLEAKISEKIDEQKENFEQAKANLKQAKSNVHDSVNVKLNEIDEKLYNHLRAVELRMEHQHAQLSLLIKQYKKQRKFYG